MLNRRCGFTSLFLLGLSLFAYGDNFIIVGKEAKVFDEPNAKGYVTINKNNEDVTLLPGMVFKVVESKEGWYVIEYSPGLRGYLSEQAKATVTQMPEAGTYTVENASYQKLIVYEDSDTWSATIGDREFLGELTDNAIVFFDDKGKPSYSLTNIGSGPIVMSYDNSITNFF